MNDQAQGLPAVRFVNRNGKFMLLNQPSLLPDFDPNKQTWKLLRRQIPHIVLTIFFLAANLATVLLYQAKQPVDRGEKLVFDVVTTSVVLGLGLTLFEVFKHMARILRWRILSSRYFEIRKVDLILGADSLMTVFRLMIKSHRELAVSMACLAWLLINIGGQIPVAVLPLSASLKRGFDSSGTTISPGIVHVPKLNCFYRSDKEFCDDNQDRLDPAIANTYGSRGAGPGCTYNSTADISNGPQTCPYLVRNDHREFVVRYADLNPADLTNAYPYYRTERIVTTAATNCTKYRNKSPPEVAEGPDGLGSEFVWSFENSIGTHRLSIPRTSLASWSTTYIWNGTKLPPLAKEQACGPRCVVLYALRDMYRNIDDHEITVFRCHITVSPVTNVTDPEHELSQGMARTAAASIALNGRWRRGGEDWRQFQLYQDGGEWAAELDDSPEEVGARMAEFAAATLATMAQRNPKVKITGSLPTLGYQMDIEWKSFGGLMAAIFMVHIGLVLLMLWVARSIIVVDESSLVLARLLQDLVKMVSHCDDGLGLLQGSNLAGAITAQAAARFRTGPVQHESLTFPCK